MTVREELYAIRASQAEINILQERIEEVRYSLYPHAIAYDGDKVQTSPSDRMSEVEAKIDEYIRTMQIKLQPLIERKIRAEKMIESLQDSRQRQALSLYFLSGKRMSMEDVGSKMGYSRTRTYIYWSTGLEELERNAKTRQKSTEKNRRR